MGIPITSQLLFLVAAALGAVGQWLYKAGVDRADGSLHSYLIPFIVGGMSCYTAVMVLFIVALKRGGQPQVLYPIYASTFVFAAVLGWWLAGQPIRLVHVSGMVCLFVGMFLMGR